MTEAQGDDRIQPLSGNPFFSIIICPSHIKPEYNLYLPAKMHEILPSKEIPAVLMCKGKEWKVVFHGVQSKWKKFNSQWKHFVDDNDLKIGDACIFELMACTERQLKFRVQILRGDIPSALRARIRGESIDRPLVID